MYRFEKANIYTLIVMLRIKSHLTPDLSEDLYKIDKKYDDQNITLFSSLP